MGAEGVEDGRGSPLKKPGRPGRQGGRQLQGGGAWGPHQGGGPFPSEVLDRAGFLQVGKQLQGGLGTELCRLLLHAWLVGRLE